MQSIAEVNTQNIEVFFTQIYLRVSAVNYSEPQPFFTTFLVHKYQKYPTFFPFENSY